MQNTIFSVGLSYTTLNENECALSGIGHCQDTGIVIPVEYMGRKVVQIADMAFAHNHDIVSIMVPPTVKHIGDYAFAWCHNLHAVTFENHGVNTIGERCFIGCDKLTQLYLGDSLIFIGEKAFAFCASMRTLVLPLGTREVGHSAFEGCRSLESVILPESLNSLPDNMFGACISLTSVSLSGRTRTIGYYAFSYCRNLRHIDVGSAIVHEDAFYGCESLAS